MPLYEYRCTACGHRFEKIQTFSAPDEKECPVCHAEVERLISAPAVHFSGSGFYSTDYPSKTSGAPKSSEGGAKDGASGEGASKSGEGAGKEGAASSGDVKTKTSPGSDSSTSTPATSSAPASPPASSKT